MNIKHRQTCRICGNPNLTRVIDLGEQYFQGSFVKEGVINPPMRKVPNLIVRCDTSKWENACGLIQTKHTIPPKILYSNYWYQSGITATMKAHLASIVNEAQRIVGKTSGKVLDIASNDNTLLRNYSSHFRKTGIDPSDIAAKQQDADITVISDIFPTIKLNDCGFDIVTSIACYYDVEDPRTFASEIKKILRHDGIWIFEVAYWKTMVDKLYYDSCVNEHIIHYHLAPLEYMFNALGLKIFDARETTTNGGSIMCFVTHANCDKYDTKERQENVRKLQLKEFDAMLDDEQTYRDFRTKVEKQAQDLISIINEIKKRNKTIHILGSSTKLNTILGYCNIGPELIQFAAERSPDKVGATTISGIKIISEEESRAMNPDYYLVGPYHFKAELLKREEKFLNNGGKFIFPLPTVEIISKDN